MSTTDSARLTGIPPVEDVARGILEESMRVELERTTAAFTVALEDFHRAYSRAYAEGSRYALDNEDRRQAHDEAITEAFDAGLARYLRETGDRS